MSILESIKELRVAVIIVAGGSGNRMGTELPKQFLELAGRPILMRTVEQIHAALPWAEIVVVLPEGLDELWGELTTKHYMELSHTVCIGGENRFSSVQNALLSLDRSVDYDFVAVHDGVRPLASETLIRESLYHALRHGSAIPVVAVNDSIRTICDDGILSTPIDRSRLRAVQTPQIFEFKRFRNAYAVEFDSRFTDDASVYENSGHSVSLCDGERSNIKITTKADMLIAETFLKNI